MKIRAELREEKSSGPVIVVQMTPTFTRKKQQDLKLTRVDSSSFTNKPQATAQTNKKGANHQILAQAIHQH